MATSAPSSASALAMAAPMPREPPVTRATFPIVSSPWVHLHCELFSVRYICGYGPSLSRAYIAIATNGEGVGIKKMAGERP